jgi:hypothetical protein
MYGGQGMGSNGSGISSGGGMDIAALLAAMRQGQNGGMAAPSMASPMGMTGPTPMSNYIQPQGGMMGQHPTPGAVAAPQQAPNNMAAVQQLLQSLRGNQTGVAPTQPGGGQMAQQPPQLPPGQNPMAGAAADPNFMQMLLQRMQGMQQPQVPQTGAGGMT